MFGPTTFIQTGIVLAMVAMLLAMQVAADETQDPTQEAADGAQDFAQEAADEAQDPAQEVDPLNSEDWACLKHRSSVATDSLTKSKRTSLHTCYNVKAHLAKVGVQRFDPGRDDEVEWIDNPLWTIDNFNEGFCGVSSIEQIGTWTWIFPEGHEQNMFQNHGTFITIGSQEMSRFLKFARKQEGSKLKSCRELRKEKRESEKV